MPTFVCLFNWTDQGIKNVRDTTKRSERFTAAIKKAGGSVKGIYWTLGRYDGLIVFEAPDEASATAIMLSGGTLGSVRTETLRAFDAAEMDKILAKMRA
jgi:uncharacterized protein with GYD domain